MFCGLDEDALAHEGRGVRDARYIATRRWNFEVVQVGAAEDDAGASRRGNQTHGDVGAGVKAYSVEVQRGRDRVLELWICMQRNVPQMKGIPGIKILECGKFATGLHLESRRIYRAGGGRRLDPGLNI